MTVLRDTARTWSSGILLAVAAAVPILGSWEGAAFANAPDGAGGGSVASNGVGTPFELSFWQSVAQTNDRAQFEAYLAQYPGGTFSGLARAKIAALSPPVAVPVTPAPVATPMAVPAMVVAGTAANTGPAQPLVPSATAAPLSLLDQLTAVGKNGPTSTVALFTEKGAVPPRPVLDPASAVAVPDHFCSAVDRNSFHETAYVSAVAHADRNNEATIAHLHNVQTLHAQSLAANDVAGANALAREATAFKPIADQAYRERAAMADIFARIMAAPITGC